MPRIGISLVILSLAVLAEARAEPVYFVVAERPGEAHNGDSYILPLDDPDAIAHARALIELGPDIGESIVVASIAAGTDGINRDYLAFGAPEWSWHVTAFEGFADFTAEILDGWPTFVEEDVDGWISNTGGLIGFWGYTVVAELPVSVPEPSALTLFLLGTFGLLSCKTIRIVLSRSGVARSDLWGEGV